MAKEIKRWITVEHNHIPIYEGESRQDVKERIGDVIDSHHEDKTEKKTKYDSGDINIKGKKVEVHKKPVYTAESFNTEAKKQGLDLTSADIEDYVTSSYGGVDLGDKVSKFIDNCPDDMKVGDEPIYRGLYFEGKDDFDKFIREHSEGDILETRRDGLSWSKNREVADVFSRESGDYYVTLVNEDDAKNAISIKDIADTPGMSSDEVLYSSSTDFEVTDVEVEGNHATLYVTEAVMSKKKYK